MTTRRILGDAQGIESRTEKVSGASSVGVPKTGAPTAHFHQRRSDSTCTICNASLRSEGYNCAKCGLLFCRDHRPRFELALDSQLEVVPYTRKSEVSYVAKCCEICLHNSPGWTQAMDTDPVVVDRTSTFVAARSHALQKSQLDNLILERRVGKLVNWVAEHVQLRTAGTKIDYVQLRLFETKLCKWSEAKDCEICASTFGFFSRRHHCKLCGKTVCGDVDRGCSMPIPLSTLCEIMDEPRLATNLANDDNSVRVCKQCRQCVFDARIFKLQQSHPSEVFRIAAKWNTVHSLLEKEDLSQVESNAHAQRLVNLFSRADAITKEITVMSSLPTLKRDESLILINLQMMISDYIQIKLPLFRRAQEDKLKREQDLLKQMTIPTLTKREIRELREKLMVLNEQKFLVQNIQNDLKKQRKFEDLKTLEGNIRDLDVEIEDIQRKLGEEAF